MLSNLIQPPEDPELAALAARMGVEEFAHRFEQEAQMRARRGAGQGRGLFRFEHLWDMYGMIRGCLKVSGFWGRAHRNYFDIQVVQCLSQLC